MRLRNQMVTAMTAFAVLSANAGQVSGQSAKVAKSDGQSKIESAIWKSGILSPQAKLSLQIVDKQAIVTIYSAAYEKATAVLEKIDAVLIAKYVFDNDPEVLRVKVGFGAQKAAAINQISISKGDIKAFASNQLSKADLLASLEVTQLKQPTGQPVATGAPKQAQVQRQESLETLSQEGASNLQLTAYRNAQTGLSLSYPNQWKLVESPDKDTLFRLETPNCSLSFGVDHTPDMTVKQAARFWDSLVFSQLENCQQNPQRRIRIGKNASLEGVSEVVQFTGKGVRFRQRWIFFGQTGSVFRAVLTMPASGNGQDIPDVQDMYKALMSLTFTGGTIAAKGDQTNQNTQAPAHAEKPWSRLALFQEGPVTINYPAQWQVNKHPEPEVIVKIQGTTDEGSADLSIRRGMFDRNASLEDIAALVETNYLKPLKSYRRLRQETVNLPGGSTGLLQEFTFEASGMPFRQISTYRREGDHLYTLSITAVGWKQSDVLTLFNRCLGTWSIRE